MKRDIASIGNPYLRRASIVAAFVPLLILLIAVSVMRVVVEDTADTWSLAKKAW